MQTNWRCISTSSSSSSKFQATHSCEVAGHGQYQSSCRALENLGWGAFIQRHDIQVATSHQQAATEEASWLLQQPSCACVWTHISSEFQYWRTFMVAIHSEIGAKLCMALVPQEEQKVPWSLSKINQVLIYMCSGREAKTRNCQMFPPGSLSPHIYNSADVIALRSWCRRAAPLEHYPLL